MEDRRHYIKKKVFDWTISFGNVLTIFVFAVGGVIGYTRLEDQVLVLTQEVAEHKTQQQTEMRELVRKDVQDTRNSFIDRQLREMQEKLDAILAEIKRRF